MTLSNLPFSATRLTLAALLAVSTAFAQGSGPDDGALWQPMFDSSGAIPPSGIVALHGGPPPVLGSTTAVQVLAPGFQFAFVAVSLGANEGYPVQIGLESLDIYIAIPQNRDNAANIGLDPAKAGPAVRFLATASTVQDQNTGRQPPAEAGFSHCPVMPPARGGNMAAACLGGPARSLTSRRRSAGCAAP